MCLDDNEIVNSIQQLFNLRFCPSLFHRQGCVLALFVSPFRSRYAYPLEYFKVMWNCILLSGFWSIWILIEELKNHEIACGSNKWLTYFIFNLNNENIVNSKILYCLPRVCYWHRAIQYWKIFQLCIWKSFKNKLFFSGHIKNVIRKFKRLLEAN